MRRLVSLAMALVLSTTLLVGCGDHKTINGVTYDTYGLLNSDDKKNPNIQYEIIWGNVIWGALLFETIIAPIYFFGFSCFEPVGKKPEIKGEVVK